MIFSPIPQTLEGDVDGAGTPDCPAVRTVDPILDLDGEAAIAAARSALDLVGEVGPARVSALAATFLGESDAGLAKADAFVEGVGAGAATGAVRSF